ncbi:manganese efflux pump [Euhalothece natronophila Z-M001]|uniref:Putative manganese efflux pump MntP n=1 Tax=Euhalothece natronophila Z-M001 TaxID=522448 RepID=A0A5B8NLH3_9CHRO|nr:manganese efflux pump MntP family protein [Euhalothece natronophila]QDZ39848.1 manganese efflux pump [Euhalothece natronophila Z-M001]
MQIITIGLLSAGLAADAFAVSLTSGLLIKRIKLNKALKIALFFGVFQTIMPILGWFTGLAFRELIDGVSHWLVFVLLVGLGLKMIYEGFTQEKQASFNPLENYTLIGLAVATSIDGLAAGIGLSILEVPLIVVVTTIGFITFLFSIIGVFMGHYFGHLFENQVEYVGGVVLIGVGTNILLEGLGIFNS